jgi:hydroxypyruvate isomerase
LLSLAGVVLPDASRAAAMRTFVENLRGAADLCAPLGATLLIETNNVRDNPNYLLRTLAEAREIIYLVERSNLKIIFDFYHVQINEGDVTRAVPRIPGSYRSCPVRESSRPQRARRR